MIPNQLQSLSEPLLKDFQDEEEASNLFEQPSPFDNNSKFSDQHSQHNLSTSPCNILHHPFNLCNTLDTINPNHSSSVHLLVSSDSKSVSTIGTDMNVFSKTALHNKNESQLSEPLLPASSEDEHSRNVSNLQDISSENKSKNITPILIYTFIVFSARSLWNQSVISAYVYLLKSEDPKFVGALTGLMGISQLFTSFPAGYLADKYRRDFMLKIGSIVGFIAAVSTFFAARSENFILLGCALAIWGLFWGICNTTTTALFADSIPKGSRSYWFTQRSMIRSLGGSCGPIMALVMFLRLGDDWNTTQCATVICIGQMLSIPALALLCFMNDDYCINHEDNSTPGTEDETNHDDNNERELDVDELADVEEASEGENNGHPGVMTSESVSQKNIQCIPSERVIPVLVALSDVLGGLASGMSIRYFPIFFLENLKLSPVNVQVIFIASTLCMTGMTRVSQWTGTKLGRIQATLIFKWTGVVLFFVMISCFDNGFPPLIICIIFVIRFSVMNAPGALTRSVLMDNVPRHERAKWSALESVTMFSWSGSAVIGGILVNWNGILFNFTCTAWFQLISTIPLVFVSGRVRREHI